MHTPFAVDPRGGGTPYNGLYGEALPERGTFFTLQVYDKVGISRVEVYERVGKFCHLGIYKGLSLKYFEQIPYDCTVLIYI